MSGRAFYVSSSGGRVPLDGKGAYIGTAEHLRGRAWSYSLGARSVTGLSRPAREVEVEVSFADQALADRLRELADADAWAGAPGEIEVDGEWRQRALILKSEASRIGRARHREALTVALLDGCWWRELTETLRPIADDPSTEWLDLPADAPFDLMGTRAAAHVTNSSVFPASARITFWGPCIDPEVTVGGNLYKLELTVPEGARAVVDGTVYPRTIRLVTEAGDVTDEFAAGVRGTGEGGGSYIFERLPPGRSEIGWDGSFGVDIAWREEVGQLPWTRS